MPSYQAHMYQAQHNERLLSDLMATLSYKDWVVTVAFYAAIHYVEADFFNNPSIGHTEATIPTYPNGNWRHSPHYWRMQLLKKHYPQEVWHSFRSLYNESRVARYLISPSQRGIAVNTDAQTHWTDDEAKEFVDIDLTRVKGYLGFSQESSCSAISVSQFFAVIRVCSISLARRISQFVQRTPRIL